MNPLQELTNAGQSIWLDFITRPFMSQGHLQKLIQDDSLRGVTSNPTIFQKAVASHKDYDEVIRQRDAQESTIATFESFAIQDIQMACDLFKPVYEATRAKDGYVSLEVNPHLARNTPGTLEEARRLFKAVNRPNVMIKIPGTQEGLPAIEEALYDGININITLIFSVQRYEQVLERWLKALERRAAENKPLDTLASVASFFVSRVDSTIDKQLESKGAEGGALLGKAAIANAKWAYAIFQAVESSSRWKTLASKGAQLQRPLWASTSTKNPAYRDVIYVEELIGPNTVNTLPPQTLDAFRDHGKIRVSLTENLAQAKKDLEQLKAVGINLDAVTQQLEDDGLKSFSESFDQMLAGIDEKKKALAGAR